MHGFGFKQGGIAMAIVAMLRWQENYKNQLKISHQRRGRRAPARWYVFNERLLHKSKISPLMAWRVFLSCSSFCTMTVECR
jgi:hypothetical protein